MELELELEETLEPQIRRIRYQEEHQESLEQQLCLRELLKQHTRLRRDEDPTSQLSLPFLNLLGRRSPSSQRHPRLLYPPLSLRYRHLLFQRSTLPPSSNLLNPLLHPRALRLQCVPTLLLPKSSSEPLPPHLKRSRSSQNPPRPPRQPRAALLLRSSFPSSTSPQETMTRTITRTTTTTRENPPLLRSPSQHLQR